MGANVGGIRFFWFTVGVAMITLCEALIKSLLSCWFSDDCFYLCSENVQLGLTDLTIENGHPPKFADGID